MERSSPNSVAVVGLGYVGLPLAGAFHAGGLRVLGVDVDPVKVTKLERGESYFESADPELVPALQRSERFEATTDFARIVEADAVVLCVPTPLGEHRDPDLSYVRSTCREIAPSLVPGQTVVLVSTSYPGTTRDVVTSELAAARPDLVSGRDLFIAYSPEREDPGNQSYTTSTTPRLVGGTCDGSRDRAATLFRCAVREVHVVSSAEVAEAAKMLENTFRAVNIALVNEFKLVLSKMGVDVFEVVRAAATKPFGFMPFRPGPGLGGHCIPIDPFYLSWKARELGVETRFVELAGEVNSAMPAHVVRVAADALNEHSKCVRGAKVLLLGLAYKRDVDDVRESPAFEIAEQLLSRGAVVTFADPHVATAERERNPSLAIERVEPTPESVAAQDVVIVVTDHSAFPYPMIAETARLVVDTRGVFEPRVDENGAPRIVRA